MLKIDNIGLSLFLFGLKRQKVVELTKNERDF